LFFFLGFLGMKRKPIILTIVSEEEWNARALAAVTRKPKMEILVKDKSFILQSIDRNRAEEQIKQQINETSIAQLIGRDQKEPKMEVLIKEQNIEIFKTSPEIEFEVFQQNYKQEMKEKFLLNQIATALVKIQKNQATCLFISKQIDAAKWAQEDLQWNKEIYDEFNNHIKLLTINCNSKLIWTNEDWLTLKDLLRYLPKNKIEQIRQMIEI